MPAIPTQPEMLTPEWLTTRLSAEGHLKNGEVIGFTAHPIGTGQVGDSARIQLTYDNESAGPATIVAKCTAADPASRHTAMTLGLYAKEIGFYREIAPHLAVRVPQMLAAEVSDDGGDFMLLLEDMGPARGGNQLDSCSIEDARAAICQAAAFHAPSWNNPEIVDKPWLRPAQASAKPDPDGLYAKAQAVFRARYADMFSPELIAVCDQFNEMSDLWFTREHQTQCIVHGDFRLDNLLFDIKKGQEPIAVLDWQTVTVGNGLTDIGYFLGTGIGDTLRRRYEDELLDLYCAEMNARGVMLSRDAIWDDYVIGALHGVVTAVFSSAFVERTPRGDANFLSMAHGACSLALQHGSLSKLKERT